MDLKDYYYYGFQSQKRQDKTRFEDDLKVLEEILSDKMILNKRGLDKKLGFLQRLNPKRLNWQGRDSVSICKHPFSKKNIDEIQQAENRDWHNAFPYFIGQCLSFILSDEVLKNIKPNVSKAMGDEIQILGNVPLEYVVGLGVPSSYLEKYGNEASILRLKEVLEKYKCEIPIYDIGNNREYGREGASSKQEVSLVNGHKTSTKLDILEDSIHSTEDITRINQINEQVKVIKDQQKSKEEQQISLEH